MPVESQPTPGEDRAAPAPVLLSRSEVVPLLRADLVVGRGASPGLFELTDPTRGRQLVLFEFELSVARMLDGRRRVAEVIENGDRLGIPVDPGGLSRFVQLLERQGFLAPAGTASVAGSAGPWAKRRTWDARTRARFQSGVRLVRLGRPDEAVASFREILAGDPENPEAHEMLALIAAGHALAARPIGEVFQRPVRLAAGYRRFPGALGAAALLLLAGAVGLGWLLVAPGSDPRAPARLGPGPGASPADAQVAGRRRSRAPVASPAEAPRAPAPLAETALPTRRTAPIERRWHPTLAEVRSPAAGVLVWKDPVPLRVARGERLADVRARAEAAAPGPEAVRRVEELQRLAAEDPVYLEFLEKERAALRGRAGSGRTFGIAAPAAGQVTQLVRTEARVAAGDLLARVVDADSWRVSVLVRGEPPDPRADCEIAGDGADDRAPCHVLEARVAEGQVAVTLALRASTAPWLEQARSTSVRLGGSGAAGMRKEGP
jgi:hypothetical protein